VQPGPAARKDKSGIHCGYCRYSFRNTGTASKLPHSQSNCAMSTLGSVVCGFVSRRLARHRGVAVRIACRRVSARQVLLLIFGALYLSKKLCQLAKEKGAAVIAFDAFKHFDAPGRGSHV
jgi:hypothetical protein